MKRHINTLNEEINRMKSLFTEERLFGNLITEDVNEPGESISEILTSNDFSTADAKSKEPTYSREFKPYNIVKIKQKLNEKNLGFEDDFDFNRASLKFSVTLKGSDSWLGFIEFNYIDDKDKQAKLTIQSGDGFTLDSTKKTNPESAVAFKTQFAEALKSEWFNSKSGTNPEFSTKKDAGDVKQQRKDDVKATRKEINMSKEECRDHVKDMYKQVRQGKTKEEFEKGDIQGVEFCMRNFYQTFEKEGLFRKGDEIRIMYKTLGIKPTEKMIELGAGKDDEEITGDTFDDAKAEGGVEGERYVVKDQNGTKVAIIRKVGANKFNFRSKVNIPLVDKNDRGNIKFNKNYVSSIYKELNIDPNKQRIVIQKATETDKMDVGTFVLTNV
jgi:ribosome-binding protein aMBF1 (putative translation factor)